MQYACTLDRDGLVDLAIARYFASVDRKELDAALECFHDNAMFTDFFRHFDVIVHRDFTLTVDERNGRIAAAFIAEMTDARGQRIERHSTNFWRVREGRFQEVYVYMSGANMLT